jgi:hypothetical protein
MPTIASFYGIVIMMFLLDKEHNPPYIHAFYGEFEASFTINDGEIMNGTFPKNGKRLVKQFVSRYKTELLEMWNTGIYKKLPPLT